MFLQRMFILVYCWVADVMLGVKRRGGGCRNITGEGQNEATGGLYLKCSNPLDSSILGIVTQLSIPPTKVRVSTA